MPTDPEAILQLLKDPNVESQQVAEVTGTPREEAARAARLVHGIARASPDDVATLPAALALAVLRAALAAGRADVLAAAAARRDLAKEAKRGLHLLRSRGIAVPEPVRAAPPTTPTAAEPQLPCFASSVDGRGERVLWIARNLPGKGVEVAQAVISDVRGLTQLQAALLGRKEYRSFGKDIAARGAAMGIAEIDPQYAKALVADARRLNDRSGEPPPDGADAWLARLGPAAPLPDLAARFPALAPDEEAAAVAESARLHDLPVIRGWLADEDVLRGLAQKLDEVAVSPLYVDDRQRLEQSVRTIADTVQRTFDAEGRQRWSARLLTVAAHLDDSGDPVHARLAAAVARALARGDDPARIPFARLLVEKAFPTPGPSPSSAPAAASPLIVAPR